MNSFSRSRSVLVMDNASIHKTFKVQKILVEYGIMIIYLPPYSPDFNPVIINILINLFVFICLTH